MAITPPPALNGRPRKQLSEELDRLDEVINGMEECLPQAVADAARDGIRQAIHDVVKEIVSEPATLNALRTALLPEFVPLTLIPKPSAWARLKAIVRNAAAKAAAAVGLARQTVTSTVSQTCQAAKTRVARWTLLSLPLKSILGVSLSIGVVVAIVSLAAPHVFAAAISGIGAAVTTAGIQTANWLRRRKAALGMT